MGSLDAARAFIERIRGRLVVGIVLIVGLYFVVAFGEQAWRMRALQAEVAGRQAALAELQTKHDALQRQLDYYSSNQYPAYVERIARRDLNLSHPGETVVIVRWDQAPPATPTPTATPTERQSGEPNWRRWLDLLGTH